MTGRRAWLVYLFAAAAAVAAYLAASAALHRTGFPLDDAWIHQTYARSWVRTGEWAFQPGEPSAGSTSPLWSALMAGGHLLGIDPVAWSAALGVLTLAALGALGAAALRRLVPGKPGWAFWGGLVLVFEWHLVWAAVSGMETLLASLVAAWVLVELLEGRRKPDADLPGATRQIGAPDPLIRGFGLGLLCGLGLWLRPDLLTLVVPVGIVLPAGRSGVGAAVRALGAFAAGLLVLAVPYLALNVALSGEIWPTTFFAKQAEYAAARELPFFGRLAAQLGTPLVGVGLALLPWLAGEFVDAVRRRRWGELAAYGWVGLMAVLYALRLPVTYQHGRYMIPVVPVVMILGFAGLARHARPGSPRFAPRVAGRTGIVLAAAVLAAFFGLGGRAFAYDVAVIESEMVAAAEWVAANTGPDALIAAHDIGALGYFGGRRIVDLAGLVSPEVVPILRDEAALADLMDARGVDLFMTLRGWYPDLETGLPVLFETGGRFSPALGGANMVLYEWILKK
ncbi:MAG TPA: hypothetical protein VMN57_00025 [Anaerolineales bacterium]|nr:hypothetical protein [Anaerolineales bacterium]